MRRRATAADVPVIDIYSFLLSDGCDGLTAGNVASSPAEARRAWSLRYRRPVWEHCAVGSLPYAAKVHDQLTNDGERILRDEWDSTPYPAAAIHEALNADRAAIRRFRQSDPAGATAIADYLTAFLGTLDECERECRRVEAGGERRYPTFESSKDDYGDLGKHVH